MGNLEAHIQALPRQRVKDNRWNGWKMEREEGNPQCLACSFLRSLITLAAFLLQPPNDSTTTRWKRFLLDGSHRHANDIYAPLPQKRAWHWVTAALLMVSCWTGDTTITSRAADRLLFQQGRKISAERLLEQGKREGASLGAKTVEWARGKMTSRRLSCRWIMSPLPLQVTRWSPMQSAPVSQTGQDKRSITICKPTHYLKQRRNSQSIRCKPRFERGTILSQSPAWWIEDDKARDLVWTSGAFWRKDSNLDWSIDQLRWHWRTGTSMSLIEA